MMIYVLMGVGIVLFAIGASFVLKACLSTPNDNTIVPKPEFDKVKLELTQSKEFESKLKGQIEQLKIEFGTAKQNLEASKGTEETALKNLQEWQTKTASSEETYKTTIHQLETELNLLREKAETQAKDALKMVTSLRAENESLKGNSEALKLKDQELEKNKESLKTLTDENETLNKQKNQVAQLISEKESLAKDLEIAQQKVQELNTALLAKQEAESRIAGLENGKTALLSVQTDLQRNLEKVKELNLTLLKKEEMIQYELTKARAQAMGLEKISEDFKMEIEKQSKQINDLKAGNQKSPVILNERSE